MGTKRILALIRWALKGFWLWLLYAENDEPPSQFWPPLKSHEDRI